MLTRNTLLALTTLAGLTTSVGAQETVTLRLERTENFDSLTVNTNEFFVGNALYSIETDGTMNNWFVGGYRLGSAAHTGPNPEDNWSVGITRVTFDEALNRSFIAIPSSRSNLPAPNSGEGITGMDYAPGVGLIVSRDLRGGDFCYHDKHIWYDVNRQQNPIVMSPVNPDPMINELTDPFSFFATCDRTGSAGPAWDWGPLGISSGGFAYTDLYFGLPRTGPLVAVLTFGDVRPHGMDKEFVISDVSTGLQAYIYNPVNGGGAQFNAPLILPNSANSIWRDVDIHPHNGVIAARANNSIVIGERVSTVGAMPDVFNLIAGDASVPSQVRRKRINLSGDLASNASVIGQRVQILHGTSMGDLLIANDRSSTAVGQNFTDVIKVFRLTSLVDGAGILDPNAVPQMTLVLDDGLGGAPTLPTGNGIYDFAWVEDAGNPANGRLLVLDAGSARNVYVFSIGAPAPACSLDYNSDTVINPDDLGDFITDYFSDPHVPGPGGYAVSCPGNTPPYDAGYKAAFVPGGAGQCNEPFSDNLGDWITQYFGDQTCG